MVLSLEQFLKNYMPAKTTLNAGCSALRAPVGFAFDSAVGAKTAATANRGLSYVAVAWQLAGVAILPLNREGAHGIGFRAQLLLFLDEVSPNAMSRNWTGYRVCDCQHLTQCMFGRAPTA